MVQKKNLPACRNFCQVAKFAAPFLQFSHSVMSDTVTPWTAALQASLSLTNSRSLLKLMSIESVLPSNHLLSSVIPFSSRLQSVPASGSFPVSWLFTSGGQSVGASAQHQSFQWIFRVDSFRIDWFDLLAVQGTLKSLLQHHNLKASALFTVQLSHLYMTTGKTMALIRRISVSKGMSLLFRCRGLS